MSGSSIPPVSTRGVSWKVVAAVVGALTTAAVPTATMIYQGGVASEERRQLIQAVSGIREDVHDHGEWIAGAKVRLTHVEESYRRARQSRVRGEDHEE